MNASGEWPSFPKRAQAPRVLVVEDDVIVAEDIRLTVEDLGYRVLDVCERGEWAVESARSHGPDLVLMDVRLAGKMDGVEAGEAIYRELDIPVVYLTAYADEETLERARQSGPFGYLVKPFSDRGIQTAIEVALVRHRMERRLRASEQRFRQMAEAIEEVVYLWDISADPPRLLYVSPAFEAIWGRPVEELYEDPSLWRESILEEDRARIGPTAAARPGSAVDTEYRIRRPDGEVRWIRDRSFPVREEEAGETTRVSGVAGDVTERKRFEAQLEHQALHDYLTGLPNRALFRDRLEHALERAERTGERLAVLFADLRRFKVVNDSLGHDAGDRLLQEVARRFETAVRDEDTVARVGGDEFTVLLEALEEDEEALGVVRRIAAGLGEPVTLEDRDVTVEVSVGVALHRGGEERAPGPSDLVRRADHAMYRAKETPGTAWVVADPDDDAPAPARLERESRLREALETGGVTTVYQPIFRTGSGTIHGVEALARWTDPELGEVPPDVFIPLAEDTGLIVRLWERQMQEACGLVLAGGAADGPGGEPIRLHVNLSAVQLGDPKLVDRTRRLLEDTGFPPGRLWLEITESAAMQKPDTLDRLHDLGVRLVIDDFGTRYSTLARLRRLPIDGLKIDRTFVGGLPEDPEDRAIVETVLTLGETLGLEIVAEGIETTAQLDLLRELGCGLAQGHHLGRPVPAEELPGLLASGSGG